MSLDTLSFWLNLLSALCWIVCFWWMHRISQKQNSLLDELKQQGQRIESVSRDEHALLKEVHPQIGDIKSKIEEVVAQVGGDES